MDELNMNIEKKISTNYRTNGTFPFVQLFCSFFFMFCLRVVGGFFYISLLVRRCMESSMSESMFHTDSIFRDSYCIFMDCLLHLLYGVSVCVRVFVTTSVVISWLFCVVLFVCVSSILVEYVYVET